MTEADQGGTEGDWRTYSDRLARELAPELDLWSLGEVATGIIVRWSVENPDRFATLGLVFGMMRILVARLRRMGWHESDILEDTLGHVHDHGDEISRTDRVGGPESRLDFSLVMTAIYHQAAGLPTLEDDQPGLDEW